MNNEPPKNDKSFEELMSNLTDSTKEELQNQVKKKKASLLLTHTYEFALICKLQLEALMKADFSREEAMRIIEAINGKSK